MHFTSDYGLKLSVLRGTGGKALATDYRDSFWNVPKLKNVLLFHYPFPILDFWPLILNYQSRDENLSF